MFQNIFNNCFQLFPTNVPEIFQGRIFFKNSSKMFQGRHTRRGRRRKRFQQWFRHTSKEKLNHRAGSAGDDDGDDDEAGCLGGITFKKHHSPFHTFTLSRSHVSLSSKEEFKYPLQMYHPQSLATARAFISKCGSDLQAFHRILGALYKSQKKQESAQVA